MSLILPNGLRRQSIALNERTVKVLIDLEPVLRALQLHLVCPRCLAAGMGREALVGGSNGLSDATWTVSCACTDRQYQRAQGAA